MIAALSGANYVQLNADGLRLAGDAWGAKPNMAKPDLPDKPELFCSSCQRWHPRAAIVAARWIPRPGGARQAQYFCQPCHARRQAHRGPHHGG